MLKATILIIPIILSVTMARALKAADIPLIGAQAVVKARIPVAGTDESGAGDAKYLYKVELTLSGQDKKDFEVMIDLGGKIALKMYQGGIISTEKYLAIVEKTLDFLRFKENDEATFELNVLQKGNLDVGDVVDFFTPSSGGGDFRDAFLRTMKLHSVLTGLSFTDEEWDEWNNPEVDLRKCSGFFMCEKTGERGKVQQYEDKYINLLKAKPQTCLKKVSN